MTRQKPKTKKQKKSKNFGLKQDGVRGKKPQNRPQFDKNLTVLVNNLPHDIPHIEQLVRQHFASCGRIVNVHTDCVERGNNKVQRAFVVFSSENEADQAAGLSGSLLEDWHIIVSKLGTNSQKSQEKFHSYLLQFDKHRTVLVKNLPEDLLKVGETVRKHFESCGKILNVYEHCIDIKEKQIKCAFVIFSSEKEANQAKRLTGSLIEGCPIIVSKDLIKKKGFDIKLTVSVKNLPTDLPQLDEVLKKHFDPCGEILDINSYCINRGAKTVQAATLVFSSEEEANRAMERTGTLIGGHHIIVARHKKFVPPTPNVVAVTNLSPETIEEDLWQFFENCGPIKYLHIYHRRVLNVESLHAELHFEDVTAVKNALKLDGKELKGTAITVCLNSVKDENASSQPQGLKRKARQFDEASNPTEGKKGKIIKAKRTLKKSETESD